jgi:hypothetical protein
MLTNTELPALTAACVIALTMSVTPATLRAQTSSVVHSVTNPQIEAVHDAKDLRSPAQQKMASQLLDAISQKNTGTVLAAAPALKAPALAQTANGVVVDIKANVSDDLLAAISAIGGKVISKFPEYHAIRAAIPLENIEAVAGRPDVRQVSPAVKARTNASVAMEGSISHMAVEARKLYGVAGAGIVVGVLSDSIDDGYGALQNAYNSGAMDASKLSVLKDQNGQIQDGNDNDAAEGEGLAMAEIIHAVAPDAHIVFATGYGGPPQMAANILELARQGCRIIVDDLTYFNESPFQDGPIARAVNSVSEQGVLYFSSARNSGNKVHGTSGTWEGDFVDGGPAGAQYAADANGRIHVFTTNQGARITLDTIQRATQDDRVDLFWSDPLEGSTNDYDLFVVNNSGQVVQSSTTTHNANVKQDPYQSIEHIKPGQSIVIVKAADAESRFLHVDTGRAVLRYGTGGSVRGHNASGAKNAFSIAAIPVATPPGTFRAVLHPAVETFSSDGPRRLFFDANGKPLTPGNVSGNGGGVILNKPDIAAADGVSTTLPTKSGLNPFFGTSAAAPHAAAIAALLLSCNSRATPEQVRRALVGSAIATEGAVPNDSAGAGTIMADGAAKGFCSSVTTPAKTNGH